MLTLTSTWVGIRSRWTSGLLTLTFFWESTKNEHRYDTGGGKFLWFCLERNRCLSPWPFATPYFLIAVLD